MACGTGSFVSGTYKGSIWMVDDPNTEHLLGVTDDGFEIEMNHATQEITADTWGDSVVGAIYRGGNCFVNFTLLEWGPATADPGAGVPTGAQELRKAYSATEGWMGQIGCDIPRNYSFEMKFTRVSPPNIGNNNSPDIYRFPTCILDPDFPIRWTLQSRLWTLPVRVRVLPSEAGSGYRWYYTEDIT